MVTMENAWILPALPATAFVILALLNFAGIAQNLPRKGDFIAIIATSVTAAASAVKGRAAGRRAGLGVGSWCPEQFRRYGSSKAQVFPVIVRANFFRRRRTLAIGPRLAGRSWSPPAESSRHHHPRPRIRLGAQAVAHHSR